MILLINTSDQTCQLLLVDSEGQRHDASWLAGRQLARQLPVKIVELLDARQATWDDITGIGIYQGPGSFTGLRIGCAVFNTIAYEKQIPIVGVRGENWQDVAINSLIAGENQQIVLPYYGRPANITKPSK